MLNHLQVHQNLTFIQSRLLDQDRAKDLCILLAENWHNARRVDEHIGGSDWICNIINCVT
jgi:hypothetical protein